MKKMITGIGFFGVFMAQVLGVSAAYFNSTPIAQCETQITRTLQVGSENNEVYTLQRFLGNAGYLGAQPNGYFGNQTKAAVSAFQRDNSLSRTGSVGQMTRDAINERLCDTDLIDNRISGYYDDFGYASNITYVGAQDPYVRVIVPPVSTPSVYATPQASVSPVSFFSTPTSLVPAQALPVTQVPLIMGTVTTNYNNSYNYPYQVQPSGSVTINSPRVNAVYREGDTIVVAWATENMQQATYAILLENTSTGQSKTVGMSGGPTYSFLLSRELLDAVCLSSCTQDQLSSFRIVMTTPTADTYGNMGTFRAAVAPITIKRPIAVNGKVSLATSKSPVASGEAFKLYVNFPSTSWDSTLAANYAIKVKALCAGSVAVTVGGVGCGNEYTLPSLGTNQFQQEVTATIVNPMFYKQDVIFQVTVVNILGQVVSLSEAKVTVNSAPLGW